MSRRYSELLPPVLVAGCAALLLGAMGMLTPAFTDYELEAEPSLQALRGGDWIAFLEHAPAYGGSLVLRAPFALLPDLWGGGDLALFRSMAAPCLLAGVLLAVASVGGPIRSDVRAPRAGSCCCSWRPTR